MLHAPPLGASKTPLSPCQQDMINCVGGVHVLFPILEQLALVAPEQPSGEAPPGPEHISPDVTPPGDGDWVILPTNRASGEWRPPQPMRRGSLMGVSTYSFF